MTGHFDWITGHFDWENQHPDVRFGTIENIKNRRVPTVAAALDTIICLYRRHGLIVGTVNADGEFKPLQEEIPSVSFNLCANDEHVPEIKRYIWTVKDRMRSGYNSLPFEWVPRMMVIHLAANSVFWLNAFLTQTACPTVSRLGS
jgi:hypothetical protein